MGCGVFSGLKRVAPLRSKGEMRGFLAPLGMTTKEYKGGELTVLAGVTISGERQIPSG